MTAKKLFGLVVFTVIETLAIGLLWDHFFDAGRIVLASALTFAFLSVEHIVARNTSEGKGLFSRFGFRLGDQLVLGVTEIIFWDVWRLIHQAREGVGPAVAVVVFLLLLTVQHNVEHNVNGADGFFHRVFRSQGLTISFIEAVTALGWLLLDEQGTGHQLIALVPLFAGLLIEHVVRVFGEQTGANF